MTGGFLAELPYEMERPPVTGWITGIVSGLIVGVAYCAFFMRRISKSPSRKRFVICGTVSGLVAGVISATTVHIVLMSIGGLNLFALGLGLLCGVVAGTILGLIAAALFAATIKSPALQTAPEQKNDQ
jgi:high-affinity Fe2+/Pb2+ permease